MKDQNTALLFIIISISLVLMTVFAPIASLFIKLSLVCLAIFTGYYATRQLKNTTETPEHQGKAPLKNKRALDEFSL